jgi:hypothetical protein
MSFTEFVGAAYTDFVSTPTTGKVKCEYQGEY